MRSGTMIGPRSGSGAEEFTEQPLGGNGALSNHAWRLAGEVEYRRGSSQHTGPVEHHVDAVADKRRRLPPLRGDGPPAMLALLVTSGRPTAASRARATLSSGTRMARVPSRTTWPRHWTASGVACST